MSWAALFLTILGLVMNARHVIWNWPVSIMGNLCWIAHFGSAQEYAGVTMNVLLLIVNIYGWRYWALMPRRSG